MSHPHFRAQQCVHGSSKQGGVVLIIALILLMVMSMITALSIRNSGSSSQVSSNSRTHALAMQAAEAALGYCEQAVENNNKGVSSGAGVVPPLVPVVAPAAGSPYNWEIITSSPKQNLWDGSNTAANVTALTAVDMNDAGSLYKRFPECMAQYLQSGNLKRVVITARGFGPEVPADPTRAAPLGSEVWLQSTLSLP